MSAESCCLYRHYDSNNVLLYVGISLRAIYRLNEHKRDSHWWREIARVDMQHLPTREAAIEAERRAIQTEKPRYNRMHTKSQSLSALAVSRAKEPGYYPDGGGLYLHITASGARSWVYRFMLKRKAREMGLGPLPDTSLSEARGKALEARRLCAEGIDPIEHRKMERQRRAAALAEGRADA